MDYERIEKPSVPGGGFSPGKLRAMLLGVEKRWNDEEEVEARFSLRSDHGSSAVESCKDVEIVSLRIPVQQEDPADSESGLLGFEFQRAERAQHHRSVLMPPYSKPAPSKWDDAQKWIASPTSNRQGKCGVGQLKKPGLMAYGSRQQAASAKVILEVLEEADTKRIDLNQVRKEIDGKRVSLVPELYPLEDLSINATPMVGDSVPNSSIKSVSMRDMGTEMTPIASQDPSRTATPVGATTPARSPTPSRPSTPTRAAPSMSPIESAIPCGDNELSEKELKMRTRREIMVLGTQLGKMNIAAWASKEEAETASASLKSVPVEQPPKSVIESRAVAWEEAEKAKYLARFKREEIKIQAWENHQKAKTEAEMRKVEVEVERMRTRAHDKLMNKLAAARHKAVQKRAAAEAKRSQQAARTAQQAEYIRRTGRIPSSFFCWDCFS